MHIKDYLKKYQLSEEEFAYKCKVCIGTIDSIANLRRTASRNTALKISKVSNGEITPQELVFPELYGILSVEKDPRGTARHRKQQEADNG